MKVWPFGSREKRAAQAPGSQGGGGYTDAVVRALMAHAAGGTVADPSATSALESAAGAYARAFQIATVEPDNATTRALTPDLLSLMARDLIRRGEFCHVIDVDRDGARLTPAGSWDVRGRTDPATWRYRVLLSGPSGSVTRNLPAAAVIHGRYSVDPARPWAGVSPLAWASLTGRLHASPSRTRSQTKQAQRAVTSCRCRQVPDGDEVDADGNPKRIALADSAQGHSESARQVPRSSETVASGWGEGGLAAPQSDWKPATASARTLRRVPGDPADRLGYGGLWRLAA